MAYLQSELKAFVANFSELTIDTPGVGVFTRGLVPILTQVRAPPVGECVWPCVAVRSPRSTPWPITHSQKYQGDLTLIPRIGWVDVMQLLSNPSVDRLRHAVLEGRRMTWPHITWLRMHCLVEFTLEQCVHELRERLVRALPPPSPAPPRPLPAEPVTRQVRGKPGRRRPLPGERRRPRHLLPRLSQHYEYRATAGPSPPPPMRVRPLTLLQPPPPPLAGRRGTWAPGRSLPGARACPLRGACLTASLPSTHSNAAPRTGGEGAAATTGPSSHAPPPPPPSTGATRTRRWVAASSSTRGSAQWQAVSARQRRPLPRAKRVLAGAGIPTRRSCREAGPT